MADMEWYGVYHLGSSEPFAMFQLRERAQFYFGNLSTVTIRPVRLRLLAPLHPVTPEEHHEGEAS